MNRPKLSVCMIVRDNARTLQACIASIQPWVDELVVVDTGSQDETPRIAKSFGARLGYFPWIDDFAAARNASLDLATGDWLFWMDSDDTIDSENGRKLRELAYGPHEQGVLGYIVQVHCPGPISDGKDFTVVDHVKLVRNHPQIRFEGRIHEQVLPAIRSLGGDIRWTDLFVVHSGADHSVEGKRRKVERDLRLLQQDIQERPGHPFVLFNLGMTYADIGKYELAADWLRQSLQASVPHESHVRKVYALLVNCLMQLGRNSEAIETCLAGLGHFPLDAELRFRRGMLAHSSGNLDEAIRSYRSVLEVRESRHFTSIDPGINGHKTRHNLALAYSDRGDFNLAETQWRAVVREAPTHRAGWRGLGQTLLDQRKFESLNTLIEQITSHDNFAADATWLRAETELAHGKLPESRKLLDESLATDPDHLPARRSLCRLLFDHGPLVDAEIALWDLIRREPNDAAAHHNLGLVYVRLCRINDAIAAFERSLQVRPNWEATIQELLRVSQQEEKPLISRVEQYTVAVEQINLPPCVARRSKDGESQGFHCLHPQVHVPQQHVSSTVCSVCTRWNVSLDDLRPTGIQSFAGVIHCAHLGEQIGVQTCSTCRGYVQIKEFSCRHPNHSKTTLNECESCRDFVAQVRN